MLKNEPWLSQGYCKLIALTIPLALSTILGCSGGGESNPIASNLSTAPSTETDSSSSETDAPSSDVAPFSGELSAEDTDALTAALSEPDADSPEGRGAENPPPQAPTGAPVIDLNSTPTGASANVTWQPSTDSNVSGYYIHYGRQSPGEPGVCSYEGRYAVDSLSVTITDLEPNTPYFFSVSSYSSFESPCSNETAVITPPAGV